jgi:hypothetical protein
MTAEPAPAPDREPEIVRLPFPLQDGENVLQLARRHWWFLWPMTVLLVLLMIVPLVAAWVVLDAIGVRDDLGIFWWIIVLVWVLYWIVRLIFNWYRYHHDIWLVTNQRLIDSFKRHPFNLRVATADLVNVQDISVDKSGLTPTILNYGSVVCETAGTGGSKFIIAGVAHPESVQLLIDKQRDTERAKLRGETGTGL